MYSWSSGRRWTKQFVDDRRIVREIRHEVLDLVAQLQASALSATGTHFGGDQIEWPGRSVEHNVAHAQVAGLASERLLDLGSDALCAVSDGSACADMPMPSAAISAISRARTHAG